MESINPETNQDTTTSSLEQDISAQEVDKLLEMSLNLKKKLSQRLESSGQHQEILDSLLSDIHTETQERGFATESISMSSTGTINPVVSQTNSKGSETLFSGFIAGTPSGTQKDWSSIFNR